MKPRYCSTRTTYRPPAARYQRLNCLGVLLTSVGPAPRCAVTLQVSGRSSGSTRRIPVFRTRSERSDDLMAPAGESQRVRNVRAADERVVIRHRRASQVRYYFEFEPGATPADIAAIVDYCPVLPFHDANRDPDHRSDA